VVRLIRAAVATWLLAAGLHAGAATALTLPANADGLALKAWWYPAAGSEPAPVVLALHGCGGMLDDKGRPYPIWQRYAGYFNGRGMHMLALDSFSPRGLRSICETPNSRRTVNEEDRREDAYAALRWLAAQPGVDATRIFVVGWSHGAQTVLSIMDATDKFVQQQPVKPRAAAAFYPGCSRYVRMLRYQLVAPLLVQIGELDDWTPAKACEDLHRQLSREGAPLFELVVYPDSYHGFDGLGPVKVRDNVGNTRSGKATVGGNPEAGEKARAKLLEFLDAQRR
jgi:dienelactone hydrolase